LGKDGTKSASYIIDKNAKSLTDLLFSGDYVITYWFDLNNNKTDLKIMKESSPNSGKHLETYEKGS